MSIRLFDFNFVSSDDIFKIIQNIQILMNEIYKCLNKINPPFT